MDFHEAANIFPMMPDEQLDALAESIRVDGLLCPIELHQGAILDGRNRWMACLRAGVEPDTVEVNPDDPVAYVLALNLERRHLNETQRAMVAARAKDTYAKQAKQRQIRKPQSVSENLREQNGGKASDKAGEAVGVSGRSVDHASKVVTEGSKKLKDLCDAGEVSVSVAAKLAPLPKAKQDELIRDAKGRDGKFGKELAKIARQTPKRVETPFRPDEQERIDAVKAGETVLANKSKDARLVYWAFENNLAVRIDRSSAWGNPFIVDEDGTRDEVIENYRWYLDRKPSLQQKLDSLRGKVLICWCHPDPCHGHVLMEKLS